MEDNARTKKRPPVRPPGVVSTFVSMNVSTSLLCVVSLSLAACGGSISDPQMGVLDGGVDTDAGHHPDAGGQFCDAGATADGGCATGSTLVSDAGIVFTIYDQPSDSECGGVVPNPTLAVVAVASYPGDQGTCPPPMSDERGAIALGVGGTYPIGAYALHDNDAGGRYRGPFQPGLDYRRLDGDLDGFSAFERSDGAWRIVHFSGAGVRVAEETGNAIWAAATTLRRGGYALVAVDGSGQYSLSLIGPLSKWSAGPSISLGNPDGTSAYISLQASQEDHLLVWLGDDLQPATCQYRWFDLAGHALGACFTIPLHNGTVGMRPLIGAVGIERQNEFPPNTWNVAQDPTQPDYVAPPLYRKWAIVAHGLGYASWGAFCGASACDSGSDEEITLWSRIGRVCAQLKIPGNGNTFVTRDGTLVQQESCSYRWYPQLLQ